MNVCQKISLIDPVNQKSLGYSNMKSIVGLFLGGSYIIAFNLTFIRWRRIHSNVTFRKLLRTPEIIPTAQPYKSRRM